MRTIKFRGFDPINNKIIPWEGMQAWRIDALGSPNIMQFTGLLDKHGKEIYEGDLVKAGIRIGEVFWCNDHQGWRSLARIQDGKNVTELKMEDPLFEDLEIIGNIYENSELLK